MESEKKNTNIWEILGKIGALIGIVWAVIQMFSFFNKNDFVADIHGQQLFYKAAPSLVKSYRNAKKFDALIRSALQESETFKDSAIFNFAIKSLLKDTAIDSLFKSYKRIISTSKYSNPYLLESNLNNADDYESKFNYNSLWIFTIKNDGSNPFDELYLELPVSGCYELLRPDTSSKFGLFNNRIALGSLNPTYQYQIYVWSNEDDFSLKDHEDNSKFTYKNGFFEIKYSVIAKGFSAWFIKVWGAYEFPLLFTFGATIFIILFIVVGDKVEKEQKKKPKIRKTRQSNLKQKDTEEKID
jgi:hypothetical protein